MSDTEKTSAIADLLEDMSADQRQQLLGLLGGQSPAPAAVGVLKAPVSFRDRAESAFDHAKRALRQMRGVTITGKIPADVLAESLVQFQFLYESGCDILRSLELLQKSSNPIISRMYQKIHHDVENGEALADAFAKYEHRIGRTVVSTIRAAEESGTLAESLQFLADNIQRDADIRTRVRQALSYPAFTGTFSLLVFMLCLAFVVPSFEALYQRPEAGFAAPTGITAVVFALSGLLRSWVWLWLPGGIGLICLGIHFVRQNPDRFDGLLLKLPFVNRMVVLSSVGRFCDRLGLLLGTGVSFSKSIHLAKETVANRVLRPMFGKMETLAEEGRPLSEAFEDVPNMPANVVDMIRIGAEAGRLPETLRRGANALNREMNRISDRALRWVQPIGVLLVATMVVVLMLALFMPYLGLIEQTGQIGVNGGMPQ